MKLFKNSLYTGLPARIYIIGLVELINGAGSFLYPFLSLMLTQNLGYSVKEAGFFSMASMLVALPASLITSKFADKVSRKKVMVLTQMCMSTMLLVSGIFLAVRPALVPYLILTVYFFDGMTDPARAAFQADQTNLQNRQVAYSFFYLCHNIGFAFGPATAGLLFSVYPQGIFFGNAAAAFLAVSIVMVKIPDRKPDAQMIKKSMESDNSDKAVKGDVFAALKARPKLTFYMFVTLFLFTSIAAIYFVLPLYATKLFGTEGPRLYGTFMTTNAVTVIVLTPLAVRFSRNHRTLTAISMATFLYAVSILCMGFTDSYVVLLFLVFIYTLGEILHATNHDYFIVNHTPLGHRARFSSIMSMLTTAGFALGPLLSGLMVSKWSYRTTFVINGLILCACMVVFLSLRSSFAKEN
ncbi:MAG: MFS transporter [Spirochaetia bacterium]|jgi:MFS family permease|nr:MFS transporter [Spirochaetia bacterium]